MQDRWPVLLLVEGGTNDPPYPDARTNTLGAAAAFAASAGLDGVVTNCTPLLACPKLSGWLASWSDLALCSYGGRNNDPAAVAAQHEAGVSAVIVDHVGFVTKLSVL
jgi:glycerophosphodiester phosphodiesterase